MTVSRRPAQESKRISVVVPARDAATTIAQLLESLASDLAVIREILVIDDGSSDGTERVIAEVARKLIVPIAVHRVNVGNAGAARNAGLVLAQGDFVYFIDADDEVVPGGLTLLLQQLRADENADIAVAGYIRRRSGCQDKVRLPKGYRGDPSANARNYLLNRLRSIAMGSALVKRNLALFNRFPESLVYDEDTLYWAGVLTRAKVSTLMAPVLVYNVDDARMERRFTSSPRRQFLELSKELRKLASMGIEVGTLRWRTGWIALRTARALIRKADYAQAEKFLRAARAAHPRLRFGFTTFRYSFRARAARFFEAPQTSRLPR